MSVFDVKSQYEFDIEYPYMLLELDNDIFILE